MGFIDTYYLIDFENVGGNGILGCKGLKKTDHIHLFYTENAKKISLDFFEDHGEAELVIHKVPVRKQSLDMHLVSYLGFLIGQDPDCVNSYRIVSKDTDYDNILKFWKNEKGIDSSRIASIKAANRQTKTKTASGKTQASKSGSVKTSMPKAADTDERTRLNNEVQQILSKEGGYTSEVVCDVAKLSVGLLGEEHFQQKVHNELQNKYENYSDIYTLIKPVLDRSASQETKEPKESKPQKEAKESRLQKEPKQVDRTELNSMIQKTLSKVGLSPEAVGFVASTVVKNTAVKNGKQVTYRSIISKFGKKQGLDIYRTVKKHIPY